jgi:hypothetical protein
MDRSARASPALEQQSQSVSTDCVAEKPRGAASIKIQQRAASRRIDGFNKPSYGPLGDSLDDLK